MLVKASIRYRPGADSPSVVFLFGRADVWILLANVYNLSVHRRKPTQPSPPKTVVVAPVQKNGTRCDPAKYRKIHCSTIYSRITEPLIKNILMVYLLKPELINVEQHRLPRKESCAASIIDCLKLITEALNTGMSVIIIFLSRTNILAVFHCRLLNKTESCGILQPISRWFSS